MNAFDDIYADDDVVEFQEPVPKVGTGRFGEKETFGLKGTLNV